MACFSPPHQFQFPRDYSTNLGFVRAGEGYQGQAGKFSFGVRQQKDGGGNYVPWFNAPPGTKLNFLSFDHTTGRLVIDGTATVRFEEPQRALGALASRRPVSGARKRQAMVWLSLVAMLNCALCCAAQPALPRLPSTNS